MKEIELINDVQMELQNAWRRLELAKQCCYENQTVKEDNDMLRQLAYHDKEDIVSMEDFLA